MGFFINYLTTTHDERMTLKTARDLGKGRPLTLEEREFLGIHYTPDMNSNAGPAEIADRCVAKAYGLEQNLPCREIDWTAIGHNVFLFMFNPMFGEGAHVREKYLPTFKQRNQMAVPGA